MEKLFLQNELPEWFSYPSEFTRVVEQGLLDFDPWIILTEERLRTRFNGIKNRYPSRDLIPFARREDNDDIACWEKGKNGKVIIIHDFSSDGYENVREFNHFWDWFRDAVEATISYDGE
ncbi:hypothetical protein [Pectobacterium versatile]|uniref:hypothetical protein n=1 Tax=Pectobacterium versatile TaxID=2488639 RepID=UPI00102EE21D|nr:hypothetical protein [Pectobacterium versatile]MBN3194673.1 hypothetical protein [Pectobacterium versatile]TAI94661.1 hypothetical protein EG335_16750 [Pectobacterium versatile]